MTRPRFLLTVLLLICPAIRSYAADRPALEEVITKAEAEGKFVGGITPVFSQLIRFHFPGTFRGALEKTNGNFYIQELVPAAETAQAWSQKITLTGQQGLASLPFETPESIAHTVSDRLQKSCPETFATQSLGPLRTSGSVPHDGFALVMGCGSVNNSAGNYSETALVVAIKGTSDYYLLQWAERGPSNDQKLNVTDPRWRVHLDQLKPIILCPILPGEPAPYPSCANQK